MSSFSNEKISKCFKLWTHICVCSTVISSIVSIIISIQFKVLHTRLHLPKKEKKIYIWNIFYNTIDIVLCLNSLKAFRSVTYLILRLILFKWIYLKMMNQHDFKIFLLREEILSSVTISIRTFPAQMNY